MSDFPTIPLYQYSPLASPDLIRVLILKPALNYSYPLECDLVYQDRNRIPKETPDRQHYEAISCTWGEQDLSRTIFCNASSSVLKITSNVDSLLRHFRKSSRARYLWLDAICLNQADTSEKDVQVALMGDIYRQARKVHIWLGNDNGDVPKVFSVLKTIAGIPHEKISAELVKNHLMDILGKDSILLIEQFLHRPWFGRRWIIQEAALGHDSTVHCGNTKISWNWLVDGLKKATNQDIEFDRRAVDALQTACAIRTNNGKILQLLWEFNATQCSDPRDSLFALYGLAKDVHNRDT